MQILSANGPSFIYMYLLWCGYSNTVNRITLLYASKCHLINSVAFLKAAVIQIVHIIWNLIEQNYTMGWKMVNFTHLVKVSFKLLRFDLMLNVSNTGESLINSICWWFSANLNICMSMNCYVQRINFMEIFFI